MERIEIVTYIQYQETVYLPIGSTCFDNPYVKSSVDVYQSDAFEYQNPNYFCNFHFHDTSTLVIPASDFFDPPQDAPLRFPLNYTPENSNGWDHNKQSFGSLNNDESVPHAAEDWNLNTGGCTDAGEPIVSIANGTVEDITSLSDSWGRTILIRHDAPEGKHFLAGTGELLDTVYSLYGHTLVSSQTSLGYNPEMDIQQAENDPISKGDPVGQVGNGSGHYGNACHLHFAILTNADLASSYRSQDPYSWTALGNFTDPSELITNGLYSDQATAFTIVVHPYECGGTFQLDDTTPSCNGSSNTIGNWTRRGANWPYNYQFGYSGIGFSKPTDGSGIATWTPVIPRNGQYRVSVYVPSSYATSEEATYAIASNGRSYDPQMVDQSAASGQWAGIGTYNLYTGSTSVSLEGYTGESGKTIAVDAVKFEYLGPIQ